ncbi:MAG: carbohydrate ABC transporter substrate-binding protein [Butyrivibrio sp.]|nr:carbohydrate ABC transporter substrate-binding protein [Butyrivibrio sp.]
MKSKRLRRIFVSIVFLLSLTLGSLFENFSQAGLVFAASSDTDMKDMDHVLSNGTTLIRIASWYREYDLSNLKAYLTDQFPDYSFEFVYIDKSNYESIMDAQLSYNGAPDIIYMDQEMVEKHAITRYIADVSDLCMDFSDTAKRSFDYGDKVYAVPNTSQFECIYYNKDIFEENGIKTPYSFQSFLETCDQLRVAKKIRPFSLSLKDPITLTDTALAVVAGNYLVTDRGSGFGGRLQYGRTTFSEELAPCFKDWQDLIQHKILTKDMYTTDNRTTIEKFAYGEAAMTIGGPETYNAIIRLNPDINMGTLPFFSRTGKMKVVLGGCDVGLALNANTIKKDEAREVLSSLATKEGQEALWKDRPGSQTYLKGTEFKNSEVYDGITECIAQGLAFLPWNDWGTELNRPIRYQLGKELQQVVRGRQSTAQALENVDRKVEEILKKDN